MGSGCGINWFWTCMVFGALGNVYTLSIGGNGLRETKNARHVLEIGYLGAFA